MASRVTTLSIALSLCLLAGAPTQVLAQRAGNDEKKEQSSGSIGQYTARILQEAIQALNMNDYKGAKAKLDSLKLDRLSPYELSRVEEIYAQISNGQGDTEGTRQHLQKALDAGGLNMKESQQIRYNIASLYIVDGKYKEGAAALENWFKTAQMPNSAAYYLLAVSYYQQNPKDNRAFEAAKKCIALMEEPNTGWMELLLAMYVDRNQFKNAIPLVKRMIEAKPDNKNYWINLSSYYQATNDFDSALAALQTAYNGGLLTQESEYRRLAQMAAYDDVPYRCAQILQKAIADKKLKPTSQDYSTLSNCWISAREFDKSVPPLEKAAELSDKGDLYLRLAQVHMQNKDWDAAANAVKKAIDKGKLGDPENAQLLMGVALYSQDKFKASKPYFERATRSSKYRKTAQSYLAAIDAKSKS